MALQRALTHLLFNTLGFNLRFDTGPLGELGQVSPTTFPLLRVVEAKWLFLQSAVGSSVQGQLKIVRCCYFCVPVTRKPF